MQQRHNSIWDVRILNAENICTSRLGTCTLKILIGNKTVPKV
jgi:hypothetical protein